MCEQGPKHMKVRIRVVFLFLGTFKKSPHISNLRFVQGPLHMKVRTRIPSLFSICVVNTIALVHLFA